MKLLKWSLKKFHVTDSKKAQSELLIKEFLKVENIVSNEQSSKQEQALIDSMMTKIEGSESCDKNPATLGVKLGIENQIAGSQSKNSFKEVKTIEERLYSSIKTEVSECASAFSKKSDNSSNKSCKLLANLEKNSNLEKFPSTRANEALISLYGSFFSIYRSFFFKIKVAFKIFYS